MAERKKRKIRNKKGHRTVYGMTREEFVKSDVYHEVQSKIARQMTDKKRKACSENGKKQASNPIIQLKWRQAQREWLNSPEGRANSLALAKKGNEAMRNKPKEFFTFTKKNLAKANAVNRKNGFKGGPDRSRRIRALTDRASALGMKPMGMKPLKNYQLDKIDTFLTSLEQKISSE